jgi:hypothetical protein
VQVKKTFDPSDVVGHNLPDDLHGVRLSFPRLEEEPQVPIVTSPILTIDPGKYKSVALQARSY